MRMSEHMMENFEQIQKTKSLLEDKDREIQRLIGENLRIKQSIDSQVAAPKENKKFFDKFNFNKDESDWQVLPTQSRNTSEEFEISLKAKETLT